MKLYNEDCMEILKSIASKSIDLVIIDPPYLYDKDGGGGAIGTKKRRYHKEYIEMCNGGKLDRCKAVQRANIGEALTNGFNTDVLDELCRILKAVNIYIWCSKSQLRQIIDYFDDKKCFIDLITWHKTNPIPTCNGTYLNDTEYCVFVRESGVKVYGSYSTKHKYYISSTNKDDKSKYHHPTIKPLKIIENFVINSSREGDLVLDCYMGSGTTGVACKHLNRDFIGVEIDKEYFETAERRITEN